MSLRWSPRLALMVVTAALLAIADPIGFGSGTASASTCGWRIYRAPSPGADDALNGVAVVSATRAWAVGMYLNSQFGEDTLIEQWNGRKWMKVPSPNPEPPSQSNILYGVTATSSTNAWAVGFYSLSTGLLGGTLIARWNGTRWAKVDSPSPGSMRDLLQGVAALSSKSAWAVGTYQGTGNQRTLIVRWNGRSWKMVSSPNPRGSDALTGIAVTSPSNAWAVGYDYSAYPYYSTLIEHWNGRKWKVVPSPSPGGSSGGAQLTAVTAISSDDAWAVGGYGQVQGDQGYVPAHTLILHWNGRWWKKVPSPGPGAGAAGGGVQLNGVSGSSAKNVWAVGEFPPIVLHWNGINWTRRPTPNPGSGVLDAVQASSSGAWAVGFYDVNPPRETANLTLHLHC